MTLEGLAESVPAWLDVAPVPVPLTAIVVGPLLALLTSVTRPATAPAAVGENDTFTAVLCPAERYIGSESPLAWKEELEA